MYIVMVAASEADMVTLNFKTIKGPYTQEEARAYTGPFVDALAEECGMGMTAKGVYAWIYPVSK